MHISLANVTLTGGCLDGSLVGRGEGRCDYMAFALATYRHALAQETHVLTQRPNLIWQRGRTRSRADNGGRCPQWASDLSCDFTDQELVWRPSSAC